MTDNEARIDSINRWASIGRWMFVIAPALIVIFGTFAYLISSFRNITFNQIIVGFFLWLVIVIAPLSLYGNLYRVLRNWKLYGTTLLHEVQSNETSIRRNAVETLGKYGYENAELNRKFNPRLLSALHVENAYQAQRILDTYILPGLTTALRDRDSGVREAAALALARMNTLEAMIALAQGQGIRSSESQETILSDPVQFSAYYPLMVREKRMSQLFLYASVSSASGEVNRDSQQLEDQLAHTPTASKYASPTPQIMKGTPLTVIPECDTVTFDPPIMTRTWDGEWIRFYFYFNPSAKIVDQEIPIRISVQVMGVEITHLDFLIEVVRENVQTRPMDIETTIQNPLAAAKFDRQTQEMYQKIFVSYSRKDKKVVDIYRFAQLAVGNDVFIDTESIRAGENWRAALAKAIDTADIFQLFWSRNSAKSSNVHDEWEYALNYKCPQTRCEDFIRPVYWVKPIPAKPPDELSHLNFKYAPLLAKKMK